MLDPEHVEQVLSNLLNNAAKFSHPGTTVSLKVREAAGTLEFAVSDQGLGIRRQELPKLFREFQQTSTRPTGGEQVGGLGLTICKCLVELHGGQIGVESELSTGSRFWFRLPLAAAVGRPIAKAVDST
jgi:two-component system response regulator PhcR